MATLELPALGTGIAYDDARDEVVVYSPAIRTIYVCPETITDFERVILPASVPFAGGVRSPSGLAAASGCSPRG